jgi:hypothetical protein
MMSPLNTMEMVKVMNAEVQHARSQFQELSVATREGRLRRFAQSLLRYRSRECDQAQIELSAI